MLDAEVQAAFGSIDPQSRSAPRFIRESLPHDLRLKGPHAVRPVCAVRLAIVDKMPIGIHELRPG